MCLSSIGSWFFPLSSLELIPHCEGPEEAKNPAGKSPPPDSDPLATLSLKEISTCGQAKSLQRKSSDLTASYNQ
jgi:hypothetical protein